MRNAILLAVGGAALTLGLIHLLALATPHTISAPPQAQSLIIEGITVIDPGSGGRATPAQTIEIENGSITYVGAARTTGDTGSAMAIRVRVDGRGKFVIPGLWDAHIHTLRLAPQLQLPLLIANGVTSVRDMGDSCSWGSDLACHSSADQWRREIASGVIVGPRLHEVITHHVEVAPTTVSELTALLVTLRERREPFVKLQLDPQVSPQVASDLLRVADSLGMRVGGHLPFTVDIVKSQTPLRSIEHDWSLLPQCSRARLSFDDRTASKTALLAAWDTSRCDAVLAALRDGGTAYVPTHVASSGQDAAFAAAPAASANSERYVAGPIRFAWNVLRTAGAADSLDARVLRDYHTAALQLTRRAHDAGVTVLAGTDALDPEAIHGFSLHEELQYLVRAGLTPAQALAASTMVPARFFGLGNVVGRIEAGHRADLVLLDANPLTDIRNTTRIHAVVADGRWFGPRERAALLQFVETQAHSWTVASRLLRGLWYDDE